MGRDPEASIVSLDQRLDIAFRQLVPVARVEGGKAHAVEPGQTLPGPHPDVAVAALENGRDTILRQALWLLSNVQHLPSRLRFRSQSESLCMEEQRNQKKHRCEQIEVPRR